MKFVALALTALFGVADATSLQGKTLKNKKFTTKLFKNAKPADKESARKLEENEFEITGLHSIIFNSCETLTVQADFDADGDNAYMLQEMYANGQVKAQKSYIKFDVCLTENCYTGDSSARTTMLTDMTAFIDAFAEFIPTKQAQYCEACEEQENYCMYQQYGDDQNYGGNRRVQENQVYEYIDCDRCQAYGCYNYNQDDNDYGVEWIQALTECQRGEYPYYFNGVEVAMGFMCNRAGTGVEIAAFMDEDCTLYTNQVSYTSAMSQTDYMYFTNTKDHIEYMFKTGFSCMNPEVTYINPYDEAAGEYGDEYYQYQNAAQYGQDYGQDGDYEAPEAAEWCQSVFEGDMEVVDMDTCGYDADADNGDDNQEEQADDQDNYYVQQTYTIAEEDADNGYAVCTALNGNGGEGEHLYDKSGSGSLYKYRSGNKKQSSDNWEEELKNKKSGVGAGFWILGLLVVGAVGAAAFFYTQKGGFSSDKKKPMLSAEETGTMA